MSLPFFIFCYFIGFLSGVAFYIFMRRKTNVGTLLITDDEDGTFLSLELKSPVDTFRDKKEVSMQIRNLNNDYYGETH